ncbi:aldo/keto reductase, partial [Candidatus Aerophobetes bacterium]|nr:aldo/keto reductase [Candidatus Aerophobetes bacterium]
MKKVKFGNTDLEVSRIAFGGIPIQRLSKKEGVEVVKGVLGLEVTFIDTAYGYGDSEEKIGEAIRGTPRDELVISSKSPAPDKKTFLEHVDTSLRRLCIDYIDIYHLHGVNSEEKLNQVMGKKGAFEGLLEVIDKGKVRYAAFSSHSLPVAKKLIQSNKFQVTQIPFNFIDEQAKEEVIPLARNVNMGFIAMKPLGGGLLEDANLCFRYLMQFDGIIPDPGIERIEEMEEIVRIIENPRPLTDEEKKRIGKLRKELGEEWCHRCDYCQPCPQEIPISTVLIARSVAKRMSFDEGDNFVGPAIEKAEECTECGECVEKCPYNLNIPELLK